MASQVIDVGTTCWLVDPERGFQVVIVKKAELGSPQVHVQPLSNTFAPSEEPWVVDIASLHTDATSLEQLVNLKEYSTPNVVNSLIWRAHSDQIYTQCGLFTVAMNPFKRVEGSYGPDVIDRWHKDIEGDICGLAHAYTVAERAYRGMSENQVDQSILVSGMSGAGKTETVKICINYLSSIEGGESQLERRINDAGLVLESFGNAFTVHNANSSRFGKYTKMYFQHGKSMVGAEIKTYLLEKTRVAHPPASERNFHIFYQILRGLDKDQKQALNLTSVEDFKILTTQTSPDSLLATDQNQAKVDVDTYNGLCQRLPTLGFTMEEIGDIARVLAAILHLGNVSFGEQHADGSVPASPDGDDGVSYVSNPDTLKVAADLLGVEAAALTTALTKFSLKSVQSAVLPLNRAKAELSRDSLAAEIYERLFDWIVSKLNQSLESEEDTDECGYIAILDISGYESVARNGFEQININYTNDKLQQLYNEMLYREQEEYQSEFGWEPVVFDSDLKDTIAHIERKPSGILPLLDEVCYRQHASDSLFLSELESYEKSAATPSPIRNVDPNALRFSVKHAPGPVDYLASGFVIKNRDVLAGSLEALMKGAQSLVSVLFASPCEKGQTSVAKFYIGQLSDLMDAIRETDYSFIKCVKPNATNKPDQPDKNYIADQIKWSGVIETLQVCSRGFPEHISYDRFAARFASLVGVQEGESPLDCSQRIVTQHLGENPQAAFGKSKLYISMSAYFQLNTLKRTQQQTPDGWLAKAKSAFGWLWSGAAQ